MKRFIFIILLIILCMPSLLSQDLEDKVVYGPNWAYIVSTPTGFKPANQSFRRQGIWSLYIKEDQEEYKEDELSIFIKVEDMNSDDFQVLDLESLKKNNQGLLVNYYIDIELGDFSVCEIYSIDNETENRYLLNGYITKEEIIFSFVLNAVSKEERKDNEEAYRELLESFVYLSEE
jgi:hypothetical protein